MKSIESTGKNVDEAINNALNNLNTTKEKVNIEIIDEGSKGILSIIGKREAKVKVTLKKDYISEARDFLKSIFTNMGLIVEIRIKEVNNCLNINLSGANMGILIGYRGETLDSIQYLVGLAINKGNDGQYKRVLIDTENYRGRREETLRRLANRIAHKVKIDRKSVALEPMNPYERRIIHSELQNDEKITTYSQGDEPYRRVIVDLKKS
ncbi:RNA-binding cell elongation regulator Jag/EloR [Clostridium hydrogenum]|uniref:RNA-binding cell elongation regulator Jag/EloR n=1 Tax=Clostridium hydrogenum TaxID=2855764 RepID=UPI001F1D335B|nr:RNA-binding cell elongation regulator Jag/EloR [Clostridium hydrogenum]